MRSLKCSAALAVLAAACWLPAGAQQLQAPQVAYANYQLALRAGPDVAYPVVTVLNPNTQVIVQGCLEDYRWCDVSWGPQRGWAPANDLSYQVRNAMQPLPTVATAVGVAVVGFVLHDYWQHHYRERTWYGERDRWVRQVPSYQVHRDGRYDGYRYDHDRRQAEERRREDERRRDADRRREEERRREERARRDDKAKPVAQKPQKQAVDPRLNDDNPYSKPQDRP